MYEELREEYYDSIQQNLNNNNNNNNNTNSASGRGFISIEEAGKKKYQIDWNQFPHQFNFQVFLVKKLLKIIH